MTERHHVVPPAGFPATAPNSIAANHEVLRFDPARHLQLEPPAYVKMLTASTSNSNLQHSTDRVEFPVPLASSLSSAARAHGSDAEVPFTGLAYTAPFRVLSDEGVAAFRQVISDNEKF